MPFCKTHHSESGNRRCNPDILAVKPMDLEFRGGVRRVYERMRPSA